MADELTVLDHRITDALAALRRAREAVEHSDNSASRWRAEMAECALDGLLDRRLRAGRDRRLPDHRELAPATARERNTAPSG
jgi:hypothetical protein